MHRTIKVQQKQQLVDYLMYAIGHILEYEKKKSLCQEKFSPKMPRAPLFTEYRQDDIYTEQRAQCA